MGAPRLLAGGVLGAHVLQQQQPARRHRGRRHVVHAEGKPAGAPGGVEQSLVQQRGRAAAAHRRHGLGALGARGVAVLGWLQVAQVESLDLGQRAPEARHERVVGVEQAQCGVEQQRRQWSAPQRLQRVAQRSGRGHRGQAVWRAAARVASRARFTSAGASSSRSLHSRMSSTEAFSIARTRSR